MARYWMTALAAALMLVHGAALADNGQVQTIRTATNVLQEFLTIPENAIPPALLTQAYGIAVIPGMIKVGFILGGRHGSGVLAVRTQSGEWSNPVFIDITGASIGWQIGASSTDLILVFKSRRSVRHLADGTFTLGGSASVAAGPLGRSVSAATNMEFDAEIYSYSRSRGLFAGVAVEGAVINIDHSANVDFYGVPTISAYQLLINTDRSILPEAGRKFIEMLEAYMPQPAG